MTQRRGVPSFGCWEGDGAIINSFDFDKARKARINGKPLQTKEPRVNLKGVLKDESTSEANPSKQKKKMTEKQPSDVPKFGDWEDQVPYTRYFDQVRVGNGSGKSKGPNDEGDTDNPSSNNAASPAQARPPARNKPVGKKPHEDQESRKNSVHNVHKVVTNKSAYQPQGGSAATKRNPARQSPDSEHSTGRSARRPQNQARILGRGNNGHPSPKHRSSAETRSATPGRLPMKVNKHADEIDLGAIIPVIGVLDETKPSSLEGSSDIFNKELEERQTPKEPSTDEDLFDPKSQRGSNKRKAKAQQGCCFLWGRK